MKPRIWATQWIVATLFAWLGLFATSPSLAATEPDARILYINSYHRGYAWSDGIEQGLRETLNASGKTIETSIEYLDSRRFGYGAQIELMALSMAIKYSNYRPHLVVVSDNAAFDFAIKYRELLFPDIPIVFCGYNDFRPSVIKGINKITGINEEISIDETIALALKVHPKTRTLAFINSTADLSSKRNNDLAETVLPRYHERFNIVVIKDASLKEIKQRLAHLPNETVVFINGQVSDQGIGRALTPMENGRLISAASRFPTYTFWDFHLNTGVIGGHILTGPEQGKAAGEQALRILDGTPADSIPVIMATPARNIFDYTVMQRFGLDHKDLPPGATLINHTPSHWETHQREIGAGTALVILETLLLLYLWRSTRQRRLAQQALSEANSQLENRVAVRTTELQIANEELAHRSRRAEAVIELTKAADQLEEKAFMQRGQELAENLTGSEIAFIHFVNDDEETIELVTWSNRTLEKYCHAAFDTHYPVRDAGIWADALRQKQPVVFNDYASYPHKHGLPEGHSALIRFISVPVMEKGKVVMLTGVGNKATDYSALDVETVELISHDIWNTVQRQRTQKKLRRYSHVLEESSDEIYIFSGETLLFTEINSGARDNLGYSQEELLKMTPLDLWLDFNAESFAALIAPLRDGTVPQIQFLSKHRRKDASSYPVEVHLEPADESASLFDAIVQDITKRQAAEEEITQLAFFDPLTHLPNRRLLGDRMQQLLSYSRRAGEMVAVCMLDLDGFKAVNDTLGHEAGDILLRKIAQRLLENTRQEDTVARLGGDEFTLLLGKVTDIADCEQLLSRILIALARPIFINGETAQVSGSMGVAVFPADGEDPDLLLRYADQAMYEAKQTGKNRFLFYQAGTHERQPLHQDLLNKIGKALEKGQFELFYQPQIDCRRGLVVGVEAMVRWRHPILGLLSPAEFLPLINGNDHIVSLGEWVIRSALDQIKRWRDDGLELRVSINFAEHQLRSTHFEQHLADLLAECRSGIANHLTIEITESDALENIALVQSLVRTCHAVGTRIAIDRFGTGGFPLSQLAEIAADELKIDRSFVSAVGEHPKPLAIIEGLIGLARAFHCQFVAVGVEDIEQVAPLMALGCDVMQGYFFAHPMPAKELSEWTQTFVLDARIAQTGPDRQIPV